VFAQLHAWWTVLLMVVFIGIVVWAYSSKRKTDFDEAARLAIDDDDEMTQPRRREDGDANG